MFFPSPTYFEKFDQDDIAIEDAANNDDMERCRAILRR